MSQPMYGIAIAYDKSFMGIMLVNLRNCRAFKGQKFHCPYGAPHSLAVSSVQSTLPES